MSSRTADRGNALGFGIENLVNFIRGGAGLAPIDIPTNGCVTIDASTLTVGEVRRTLDEDNVSWRAGIDFKRIAQEFDGELDEVLHAFNEAIWAPPAA